MTDDQSTYLCNDDDLNSLTDYFTAALAGEESKSRLQQMWEQEIGIIKAGRRAVATRKNETEPEYLLKKARVWSPPPRTPCVAFDGELERLLEIGEKYPTDEIELEARDIIINIQSRQLANEIHVTKATERKIAQAAREDERNNYKAWLTDNIYHEQESRTTRELNRYDTARAIFRRYLKSLRFPTTSDHDYQCGDNCHGECSGEYDGEIHCPDTELEKKDDE